MLVRGSQPAIGGGDGRISVSQGRHRVAFEADVTKEATLKAAVDEATKRWGRIDILHNNVGVSLAGGDANPLEITEAAFDRINAINLRGTIMACKHVLPIMRQQAAGSIINISSIAAHRPTIPRRLQGDQGRHDRLHRAARLPERRIRRPRQRHPAGPDEHADGGRHARPHLEQTRAEVDAARNARVPLRQQMGTAWDVAYAALFLASDEAQLHHRRHTAG